jgi:hypothetical protein
MAKVTIEFDSIEEQHELDVCIAGFYSEPFGKSRTSEAKHYYKTTFKSE